MGAAGAPRQGLIDPERAQHHAGDGHGSLTLSLTSPGTYGSLGVHKPLGPRAWVILGTPSTLRLEVASGSQG